MLATKSYAARTSGLLQKLYQLLVNLFNSEEDDNVQANPSYYDDEELKLRKAREQFKKQVEKYKNQAHRQMRYFH